MKTSVYPSFSRRPSLNIKNISMAWMNDSQSYGPSDQYRYFLNCRGLCFTRSGYEQTEDERSDTESNEKVLRSCRNRPYSPPTSRCFFCGLQRSFSRDVTELICAMLVHIWVTCFSHYLYANTVQIYSSFQFTIEKEIYGVYRKNCYSFIWSWPCRPNSSDCLKKLDVKVTERYL